MDCMGDRNMFQKMSIIQIQICIISVQKDAEVSEVPLIKIIFFITTVSLNIRLDLVYDVFVHEN